MGQRLNIEICDKNGVIFNSYYHWSGFTWTAISLTLKALEHFKEKELVEKIDNALDMLLCTGAKFKDVELKMFNEFTKDSNDFYKNSICNKKLLFKDRNLDIATNRNDGLISFSSFGINETRSWEEGRVSINLDTKTVDFDVFINEEFDEETSDYDKKPYIIDYDFSKIPFEKFEDFASQIKKSYNYDYIESSITRKRVWLID